MSERLLDYVSISNPFVKLIIRTVCISEQAVHPYSKETYVMCTVYPYRSNERTRSLSRVTNPSEGKCRRGVRKKACKINNLQKQTVVLRSYVIF